MAIPYEQREEHLRRLALASYEHLMRGEFEVGEKVAREFLAVAKDASGQWCSLAHLRLGTILENALRYEEALQHANAAMEAVSPGEPGRYHALVLLGNIRMNQGGLAAAKSHFLDASDHLPDCSPVFCCLSALESRMGNTKLSHEYAQKALEAARRKDDREHISVAHNLLGDAALDVGDSSQAEKHFRSALAISEELDRRRGISIACERLSKFESDRRNYSAALELGQRAVQAEREMGRAAATVNTCLRVLCEIREAENPEVLSSAVSMCQTAFEAADESADKVSALQNESWFHRKLKQFDRAKEVLIESLSYLEESDEETARTYGLIGLLKKKQDRLGDAQVAFKHSLELAHRYNHTAAQLAAHNSLGFVTYEMGDPIQARSHWQAALKIAGDSGNKAKVKQLEENLKLFRVTFLHRLWHWLNWSRV